MGAGTVAVVGAGLAGLSAALDLKRRGYRVELFERSRLLGGKATSFTVDGVEVDNGQHVYLACCTEFVDFVREVEAFARTPAPDPLARVPPNPGRGETELSPPLPGLEEGGWGGESGLLTLQPRFEVLLLARGREPARLRSRDLPSPWHLAPALLSYRHLRPLDRLRLGLALLGARRPPRPGETFAAWLRRHGQSDAARSAFWDPFLVPALNAPLDAVPAEVGLFVVTTAFLGDRDAARIGYARVPLGRIAELAAARLDAVHRRTTVAGLDGGDGQQIRGLVLADGRRVACDGVVLAVPPESLARLLGRPEQFGLTGLEAFQSAPIVDVHLWYDRPALGCDFAALLDSPVQWVFEKAPGYLCCSLSAADAYVLRPSQELIDLCHQELLAVLPALGEARLLRGAATRDREATFIPAAGLVRPGPVTTCPRVVVAGAWTDTGWPATMESAVRSGRAAARALAARLGGEEETRGRAA